MLLNPSHHSTGLIKNALEVGLSLRNNEGGFGGYLCEWRAPPRAKGNAKTAGAASQPSEKTAMWSSAQEIETEHKYAEGHLRTKASQES